MIKMYIAKTIISFISYNAIICFTKDFYGKLPGVKHNGFIKRMFNRLLPCLIPGVRWLWQFLVLIIGLALVNPEFRNEVIRQHEEKENNNE